MNGTPSGEDLALVAVLACFLVSAVLVTAWMLLERIGDRVSHWWCGYRHQRFLRDLAAHPERYPEIQRARRRAVNMRTFRRRLFQRSESHDPLP